MSKSAPAAPDYTAAAQAQADSSREVTEQQTWANRPTINTPFGQQTWEVTPQWDPSTGQYLNSWTQNTNLTPESQAALDAQMGLQQGRSELAAGLLGRTQDEYGDVMDWSQFQQMGATPDVPQYGQNLPEFGSDPTVPTYGQNLPERGQVPQAMGNELPNRGQALQGQDYNQIVQGLPTQGQGPQQQSYSPEQIQRQLDTQGLQNVNGGQQYYNQAGDAIFNQWASRNEPQFQKDTDAMRTQLYNQGLKEGDKAYDEELRKMRESQTDARSQASYQATIGAGSEAARMQGMDLGLRGQQFGERATSGNFANQAAGQALQQQLGIGGQQFNQQLQGAQLSDEQRAQAMGEQFGAAGQNFQQQQAVAGQSDAQRAAAAQEQQQRFTQQQQGSQQQDAQRASALQEQLGIGGQQFNQQMAASQRQDAQRAAVGQEQLAFGQQGYNQQMQSANYQNQLRQQQIAEQMQQRGFSLNEINAILSGQQVSMPSMPSFNTAQRSEGVQSLQAAQMQGQASLDAFNAEQQATQGMMSGIAGGAMMFCDRRLKKNVTVIGERIDGMKIYTFNYVWEGDVPVHTGLMADEVKRLYPEAVIRIHGYDMVDYGRLP